MRLIEIKGDYIDMAKRKNQTSGKGILDIQWEEGKATLTTVTKDDELVYDFFKILEEYNGKSITFSVAEDVEIATVDEE